jgi:hypothetical protein
VAYAPIDDAGATAAEPETDAAAAVRGAAPATATVLGSPNLAHGDRPGPPPAPLVLEFVVIVTNQRQLFPLAAAPDDGTVTANDELAVPPIDEVVRSARVRYVASRTCPRCACPCLG